MSANQTRRTGNPCAKMTTPQTCYEVWQSWDGQWTYYVLKKYQTPEREAQNGFAKWYCAVQSPATFGRFSYGDTYIHDVMHGTRKLSYNPLLQDGDEPDGAA